MAEYDLERWLSSHGGFPRESNRYVSRLIQNGRRGGNGVVWVVWRMEGGGGQIQFGSAGKMFPGNSRLLLI